jgi:hypothetical protein
MNAPATELPNNRKRNRAFAILGGVVVVAGLA